MKRILVLLSVVALVVVMLAMSVAPAFAAWVGGCREGDLLRPATSTELQKLDSNSDGQVCAGQKVQEHQGTRPVISSYFYDNRT